MLSDNLQTVSAMNEGLTTIEACKLIIDFLKLIKIRYPSSWKIKALASVCWMAVFLKQKSEIFIKSPEATSQTRASGFDEVVVG